jgi:hypothetical protein
MVMSKAVAVTVEGFASPVVKAKIKQLIEQKHMIDAARPFHATATITPR